MRETRLKLAKVMYAQGNKDHPYVREFLTELEAQNKPVEAHTEQGNPKRKYRIRRNK